MRESATAIGELRHRLMLQQAARTGDTGGGAEETWTTVAILWGRITPISGLELGAQHRVTGKVSHEVTVRHIPGVVPAMRFREGDRTYHITAVLEIEGKRRFLKCLCEERHL